MSATTIKIIRYVGTGELTDEQAGIYGRHLQRLAEAQGGVTKQEIVEDARNPSSPLHEYFEWNDPIAAEKYREVQAQYLSRHVHAIVQMPNGQRRQTRFMHSVQSVEKQAPVYVTIRQVERRDDYQVDVIQQALRALEWWTKKYGLYDELWPLAEAINGAKEELGL